ncbi:MAG: putative metal-binding motif-containing protein [Myxococcota bacterium]
MATPTRTPLTPRLALGLSRLGLAAVLVGVAAAVSAGGCGAGEDPPNPFLVGTGTAAVGGGGGGGEDQFAGGGGGGPDPTLGGPCTQDDQCDDGFACTFDACDGELLRCRFLPDDSLCQNGIYCDGLEVCDNRLGCILGEPITCSDGSSCTINTCDEATESCLEAPRDVDGDGDPDENCGGGDCNDLDPLVSSLQPEICGNGLDDDCDLTFDEVTCTNPQHDTCLDPLDITAPGTYPMSTVAAAPHYGASCGVADPALSRDVVAALALPAGPVRDVQVTVRTDDVDVAAALLDQCGQAGTELACSGGFDHPDGGRVAKVRLRSVGDPSVAGVVPLYVFTEGGTAPVAVRYEVLPASTPPPNETCATALPLTPGTPVVASVVDAVSDVGSACALETGDLLYAFTLTQNQDVELFGSSVDGDGRPVVSLRNQDCALPSDEIACNAGGPARVFRRDLAPGTYFVAVGATAPTDVVLNLQLSPPTVAPADENCTTAPPLAINMAVDVVLSPRQDDVPSDCVVGAADVAYDLTLAQASDVLLLGDVSANDTASVVLSQPACGGGSDELLCASGTGNRVRGRVRNLAAGSYRVVAESVQGQPMAITALVRPAVPATLVPFANTCGEVQTIPPTGGFFQGNTTNAQPDFDHGCDQGGQPAGGAPDQVLSLTLTDTKRVVLDMQGSGYTTLLAVKEGPSPCPGTQVPNGCAAGFSPERSFLDLELAPNTYYVVVDGFAGNAGPWFLDVHIVDP